MFTSWYSIPLNTCSLSDQWEKQLGMTKEALCQKQVPQSVREERAGKSKDLLPDSGRVPHSPLCPRGPRAGVAGQMRAGPPPGRRPVLFLPGWGWPPQAP